MFKNGIIRRSMGMNDQPNIVTPDGVGVKESAWIAEQMSPAFQMQMHTPAHALKTVCTLADAADIEAVPKTVEGDDLENEELWTKFYYLCGVDMRKGYDRRTLDFLFPYTAEELKSAMMEEIMFNAAPDDQKRDMVLEHKQKFSQGFLLSSYRKRMNNINICLFRSEKESDQKSISHFISKVATEEKLQQAEVPI